MKDLKKVEPITEEIKRAKPGRLVDIDRVHEIFKNYLIQNGFNELEVINNFSVPYVLVGSYSRILTAGWVVRNRGLVHELIDKHFQDIIIDKDDFERRLGSLHKEMFELSTVEIYREAKESDSYVEDIVEIKGDWPKLYLNTGIKQEEMNSERSGAEDEREQNREE